MADRQTDRQHLSYLKLLRPQLKICSHYQHLISYRLVFTHVYDQHTLIYRRDLWADALAQVGGNELRSEMPSDVSSIFSVDIHRNIINGTSLGNVFRIHIRLHSGPCTVTGGRWKTEKENTI